MPELPEVENVRRVLEREIVGRKVIGVTFQEFTGVIGDMDADVFRALIVNRTFGHPQRRGKYLLLPVDDDSTIVVHLRMTGRLLVLPDVAEPVRFEHLAVHLDGSLDLRYADQRKFGRVLHLLPETRETGLASLGPEPLGPGFDSQYLTGRLARRTAPIKSFLLDQRHIAGLGNIYVDEALFLARIHPLTRAGDVSSEQVSRLLKAIKGVLRSAIEHQGTTFSSFENPYGERGSNADFLHVYGRAKAALPCTRCGTPLAWFKLSGRGTSYCANCQQVPD